MSVRSKQVFLRLHTYSFTNIYNRWNSYGSDVPCVSPPNIPILIGFGTITTTLSINIWLILLSWSRSDVCKSSLSYHGLKSIDGRWKTSTIFMILVANQTEVTWHGQKCQCDPHTGFVSHWVDDRELNASFFHPSLDWVISYTSNLCQ